MKLRYYAEAETGVDHRRTLELLESIAQQHAVPVEVVQVDPQRAPPADVDGETEVRSLEDAWDDFTYNSTLQEGLGDAPSRAYPDREDIVGNVGIVVDDALVWATRFWGTHHGWGPVDEGETAIGFLEEVQARGVGAIAERVPMDDWSPSTTNAESPVDRTPMTADIDPPTREEVRSLCTAQSFQRGVDYFEEGRVKELTVERTTVTATVLGSSQYRTTVDLAADRFGPHCSCPYDYAGECKHVVAVLLAVADRFETLFSDRSADSTDEVGVDPAEPADEDIDRLLEKADPETLRSFLRETLDDDLRERFRAFVGEPTDKSVADYKREIDRRFEDAVGRRGIVEHDTHLRFEEDYDLAETYRDRGNYEDALAIYRAIVESIRANLDRIDDSSGHYGQQLERAIDTYADCVREADPDDRTDHIDYLFEQYESAEFTFVREYYDGALRTVCTTTDDLERWLSRLEGLVPATDGRSTGPDDRLAPDEQLVLDSYLYVLDELGERDALESVLEEVYTDSPTFYRRYVDALVADGRDDRAADVVEEALESFRFSADVHWRAAEFYRGHDPERYREVLQTLFVRHSEEDAYDRLRETCSDEQWESTRHTIRTQLGRLDPERLIDLYVREGDRERALEKVLEREDLELFRRYRSELSELAPERYFETYREVLVPYLAEETGRDHYRTVIDHLEELDALGLDDRFEELLTHLREKHSNRPAFLDELDKAGL